MAKSAKTAGPVAAKTCGEMALFLIRESARRSTLAAVCQALLDPPCPIEPRTWQVSRLCQVLARLARLVVTPAASHSSVGRGTPQWTAALGLQGHHASLCQDRRKRKRWSQKIERTRSHRQGDQTPPLCDMPAQVARERVPSMRCGRLLNL